MKQFYVSISRARDRVHIYTDDKAALLDHVSDIGDRKSALELIGPEDLSQFIARQQAQPEQPTPQAQVEEPRQPPRIESAVRPYAPKPV